MITLPDLKKIRLLELRLRRKATALLAGGYRSAFRGQGMVFADYRKYIPGDDIRAISWPLTAKMGSPYIKIFEEEKNAVFIIAMDVSGSFDFGTQQLKKTAACELAGLIALSTQRNQNRIGLLLFSDRVEHYLPPAGGFKHTSSLIRDLYFFRNQSSQTNLCPALDFLHNVLKKNCHIFLFSDFFSSSDFVKPLRMISQKHDVSVGITHDPLESEFPSLGLINMEDSETGQQITVDTNSLFFKKNYHNLIRKKKEKIQKQLMASQVDYFYIHTEKDLFKQLLSFIQRRHNK